MGYNKLETNMTKKPTVGAVTTGIQNNTITNTEMTQRGSERASEVVTVVD